MQTGPAQHRSSHPRARAQLCGERREWRADAKLAVRRGDLARTAGALRIAAAAQARLGELAHLMALGERAQQVRATDARSAGGRIADARRDVEDPHRAT